MQHNLQIVQPITDTKKADLAAFQPQRVFGCQVPLHYAIMEIAFIELELLRTTSTLFISLLGRASTWNEGSKEVDRLNA